ncbi:MAG: hypothetical protein ISS70_04935 [Phycisphaerae bacterium]|nr:hypothetical protein [Phycisphaerae bacterium]
MINPRGQTHRPLSLRGPKGRGNLSRNVQRGPSLSLRLLRFARNDGLWLSVFCRARELCLANGRLAPAILLVLLYLSAFARAAPRKAAVYYSDGKVLTGSISLTSGRTLKLNIPKGGKLKTTDMITGADAQYGKVRQFTFEPVSEIRFHPEREEIRQNWKFVETTKYDEKTAVADFTPARKEFWGDSYPLRYISCQVVFSSGETIAGHLYSTVLYLETEEKTIQIVLRSKQRGDKGTKMDDLIYVTKIKMLDQGRDIAASITVKFAGMSFEPNDVVQAVTRDSLTPVPTERGDDPGTFIVKSTFGEDFYLAVKKGEKCLVGWPRTQDRKLFAVAEDHLKRQRDFYNDKKLLAVSKSADGKEVLTLVNLRRRFAPTNFGSIGGEWDKELNAIVEPWRLSIWRWKYDPVNQDMLLSGRGTFFRLIFLPEHPTPEAEISDELWQTRRENNRLVVGKSSAGKD